MYDYRSSNINYFLKTLDALTFQNVYVVQDIDYKVALFNETLEMIFNIIPAKTVNLTAKDNMLTPKLN